MFARRRHIRELACLVSAGLDPATELAGGQTLSAFVDAHLFTLNRLTRRDIERVFKQAKARSERGDSPFDETVSGSSKTKCAGCEARIPKGEPVTAHSDRVGAKSKRRLYHPACAKKLLG